MAIRDVITYDLGTLDAADETTKVILCQDFRNAVFTVTFANSASATIQFIWSALENNWSSIPDITQSAGSASNTWDFVQVVDLEDGNTIAWDTWVIVTWSQDTVRQYEVNINALNWVAVKMTARAAWDATIKLLLADNQ